jgi:hypothetical protein
MMGDFGGNAGLLSAWFDEQAWEWRFEYATCPLGRQHLWWFVHIMDLLVVVSLAAYPLVSLWESTYGNGRPDAKAVTPVPSTKTTPPKVNGVVTKGVASKETAATANSIKEAVTNVIKEAITNVIKEDKIKLEPSGEGRTLRSRSAFSRSPSMS